LFLAIGLAAALSAGCGQAAQDKPPLPAPINAARAKEATLPTLPFTVSADDATGLNLVWAVGRSDAALVRAILARNATLVAYVDKDGDRPLTLACWVGNRDIVESLLGAGADLNQHDGHERTASLLALIKGHKEIAQLLRDRGAVLVEKGSIFDAAWQGDQARARVLVEADNHAVEAQENETKFTALMCAVLGGNRDVAEWLLQKGASVNSGDWTGRTPLHLATDRKDMAELLLMWGAKVEAGTNTRETPLHFAAARGNKDVAELLIEKGAQVEARNNHADTPLRLAAYHGHKGAVEVLLASGAQPDAKDITGLTPLHWAAHQGHKDVAELLIAKGAQVDAKDGENRWTPLHLAASQGQRDVAELLIAKGAQIDVKDVFGFTPLHDAARFGKIGVVELLLEKGAQINALTNDGKTPLGLAIQKGNTEMAEFLKSRGGKE